MSEKVIRYPYFIIEKDLQINGEDISNLKRLYLPFLGPNPIVLYEYLKELSNNVTKYISPYDLSTLSLYTGLSQDELERARVLLESVSLLSTYQDDNQAKTIFILQKPLFNDVFKKNPILSAHLKAKIGQNNFNRLVGNLKSNTKRDYEDISASYFEVFEMNIDKDEQNHLTKMFIEAGRRIKTAEENRNIDKETKIQNTLNLNNNKYTNDYEAALNLNNVDFFTQLSNRIPTDDEVDKMKILEFKVKDLKIVNIALLLSFYAQNRINLKSAESLITELSLKNIIGLSDSEAYLDHKFENSSSSSIIAYKKKHLLKLSYIESLRND
ncbi:hypothetical protein [Mycoplasma crocodyli]|uniref:Replicative helicase loading/DNA remodeling protein DnaB N-terminal winged helix domain-containing protein n=1 Tax=Mycoplasma crocodyli (strain ATCC 51981 / MP145) TaxID=512564 RepID=D5E5Y3_MYCCM|nr:hypothetical protein [Mycoplasma crocodyli]ADE19664.1 conserved hypothetical protein [Mycoplasma crocodyli MP145]